MSASPASSGNVVLISGGADGIGRRIAELFLEDGANVHVCDASAGHIDEFLAANPSATASLCDISDPDQVAAVYRELEQSGDGLRVLINNAGIAGPAAAVEDIDIDEWRRCIDVNLNGTFYMTRYGIPLLKRTKDAAIINIASNAGLFGCPHRSPYAAGKWAMIGLTKTWAMELGPHGIRVNAVCPASVEGERVDAVIERDARQRGVSGDEIRRIYERQSSLRSFVSADDVAETVLFLASDRARKISGQAIAVDGHTETLGISLDPVKAPDA